MRDMDGKTTLLSRGVSLPSSKEIEVLAESWMRCSWKRNNERVEKTDEGMYLFFQDIPWVFINWARMKRLERWSLMCNDVLYDPCCAWNKLEWQHEFGSRVIMLFWLWPEGNIYIISPCLLWDRPNLLPAFSPVSFQFPQLYLPFHVIAASASASEHCVIFQLLFCHNLSNHKPYNRKHFLNRPKQAVVLRPYITASYPPCCHSA